MRQRGNYKKGSEGEEKVGKESSNKVGRKEDTHRGRRKGRKEFIVILMQMKILQTTLSTYYFYALFQVFVAYKGSVRILVFQSSFIHIPTPTVESETDTL